MLAGQQPNGLAKRELIEVDAAGGDHPQGRDFGRVRREIAPAVGQVNRHTAAPAKGMPTNGLEEWAEVGATAALRCRDDMANAAVSRSIFNRR